MNKLIAMIIGLLLSFNVLALGTEFYVKDPSELIVIRLTDFFFTDIELTRSDYGFLNHNKPLFVVDDLDANYIWTFHDNSVFLYFENTGSPFIVEISNVVPSVPEPSVWFMLLVGLFCLISNVKIKKAKG